MSLIEYTFLCAVAWTAISTGAALVIAAAFFGITEKEE
jgi:hypothetical protein